MAIIQAIGFTFGAGSGNYISRLLGQQRHEEAERIAATGFFTALIAGLILAVAGELFLEPLVRILGCHGDHPPLCDGLHPLDSRGRPLYDGLFRAQQHPVVSGQLLLFHAGSGHPAAS